MGWGHTVGPSPGHLPGEAYQDSFLSTWVFCNPILTRPSCKSEALQHPEVFWTRQLQFCGAELLTGTQQGGVRMF